MLDNPVDGPYATPSMSSLSSPKMLTRGIPVHTWTERGDFHYGSEEEGSQEGRLQEEEVSAPVAGGGGPFTPPAFPFSFWEGGFTSEDQEGDQEGGAQEEEVAAGRPFLGGWAITPFPFFS